jgi:hypothetical protein
LENVKVGQEAGLWPHLVEPDDPREPS